MPIGDYVHLHAASIDKGDASVALNTLYSKMSLSAYKNTVNKKELDNLGNELSAMKALLQNSNNNNKTSANISKAIMEFIEKSIHATISSIDWSTGKANIKKNSQKGIGQIRSSAQ